MGATRPYEDAEWAMEDFENAYRNWISSRMHASKYSILFDILYDVEFEWDPDIPRDGDRAADGRYLRERFSEESGTEMSPVYLEWPCSFLEFLVALAFSIEESMMYDPEDGGKDESTWFWEMMDNAGLSAYDDDAMQAGGMIAFMKVTETVNMILRRRYDYNGYPGLFPLKKPAADQRKVEIWYQANAYFIEECFE